MSIFVSENTLNTFVIPFTLRTFRIFKNESQKKVMKKQEDYI